MLKEDDREGLDDSITIVPVGGLEKVSSFISLLRGSKLKIICLLDSPSKSQQQGLDNLIKNKLIKKSGIQYFDEFIEAEEATIEDLFDVDDYLKLFSETFKGKDHAIDSSDLPKESKPIIKIIDNLLKKQTQKHKRFNHYLPANFLSRSDVRSICGEKTLSNFEKLFKSINSMM